MKIDKLRFYITDRQDRQRSSIWSFWNHGNEVYLAAKGLGGKMKLSLHSRFGNDGKNSQFGIVNTHRTQLREDGFAPPPPVRWVRPSCQEDENRAVLVAKVVFPTMYLQRDFSNYARGQKLKFALPMAAEGKATELLIYYHLIDPSEFASLLEQNRITPLSTATLPCGEHVMVAAREIPFDPSSVQLPSGKHASMLTNPHELDIEPGGVSAVLLNEPEDGGVIQLVEVNGRSLALNPES